MFPNNNITLNIDSIEKLKPPAHTVDHGNER